MNDTAQETTAVMTLLVEHELLGASVLPVEGNKKQRSYSSFTPDYIFTNIIIISPVLVTLKLLSYNQ